MALLSFSWAALLVGCLFVRSGLEEISQQVHESHKKNSKDDNWEHLLVGDLKTWMMDWRLLWTSLRFRFFLFAYFLQVRSKYLFWGLDVWYFLAHDLVPGGQTWEFGQILFDQIPRPELNFILPFLKKYYYFH